MILILVVALIALVLVMRRAHITSAALVTITAIVLTGAAAGVLVSPVFYATTVLLAGLLVRAETRPNVRDSLHKTRVSDLPPALQASVIAALKELPEGEARTQLLGLIADARPLYSTPSTTFDEREERETRKDVDDLIDACCESALELSAIDSVVSATPARVPRVAGAAQTPSGEVNARLAAARELVVRRLSDARTAVRTLYAADVEHGTSASERVASLAAEIKSDAAARRAAKTDLDALLQ